MKVSMGYAAKRAIFVALAAQTGTGQPLENVQVSYDYPARDMGRSVIYGGGIRFSHTDAAGEWGQVVNETVTIGLYVRVLRPEADIPTTDATVETLGDAIAAIFAAQPNLGGNMTWLGVSGGAGDYSYSADGPESVLSLQVMVGAVLV